MNKQKVYTPPIYNCWCGAAARLVDWDFRDCWRVMCDNNHTLTKECGTTNRAVWRWNNRMANKLKE